MTKDDILQAIHKFDLIQRPYIVLIHPSDAKAIKEVFPEIEEKVVLREDVCVEQGKMYAVQREEYEKWANNDFGYTWSELE